MNPSRRKWGSGGIGGYVGDYLLDTGKEVDLYVTRVEQVVVIEAGRSTFVLSPADPEDFKHAVEETMCRT